jgi:hypothetical protein
MNYYRLKMVDLDGQFRYSEVVAIKFSEELPGDVIVAPNPVVNSINVKMVGLPKGVYTVELHNTAGQVFARSSVSVTQFEQTEIIARTSRMNAGLYWLNIYDNTNKRIKTLRVFVNNE